MNEPSTIGPTPANLSEERVEAQEDRESILGLLQHYAQILLRRKLIVAIALAASIGGGYLWLQQQTPIYRASAKVLIDSNPPKVFYNVRDVVELGGPQHYRGHQTYLETQYELIASLPVAEMVLDREDLWNDEHLLGLDRPDLDLTAAEKEERMAGANPAAVLASRIQVRPVPNSMLVHIEFEDPDPAFAQRIVDAVAIAYRDHNLKYKEDIMDQAAEDLQRSVEEHLDDLESANQGMLSFEAIHNVGSIEARKKAINDRIDHLNNDLTLTQIRVKKLTSQAVSLRQYKDVRDPFGVDATLILEDEVVRERKQRLVASQTELASLKARYLEKHPDVLSKERELATLMAIVRREMRNLARSIDSELAQARRLERDLQETMKEAQQDQRLMGAVALEYDRLTEERDRLNESYGLVAKRLTETKMSSQFAENNVRVIEAATKPGAPVSPKRGMVMAASFLIGCLLAIGLALLLDYADASIKNWKDLEDQLGYKVLGVVPIIGQKPTTTRGEVTPEEHRERDLFIHRNPTSNVAEAGRTLRTNVLFMSSAHQLRTLLITSANPSEGKTMMAVHTATSMASSGSRVLLVEADMRRPRLATSFNVATGKGLSTCLVGGALDDNVQRTEVDNLDVLVCGPVPPNPAELLHTSRFRALLETMRERYDTVIFDSPPLLPVADAMVLSQQLDGVLVVVRAGRTSRHALRHAIRQLATVEAPILGMVLNYQTHKRAGYGYGYGYGYGAYGGYVRREPSTSAEAS